MKRLILFLTVALVTLPAGAQAMRWQQAERMIGNGGNSELNYVLAYTDFIGGAWTHSDDSYKLIGDNWTIVESGTSSSVAPRDSANGIIRLESGTSSLSNASIRCGSWESHPVATYPFFRGGAGDSTKAVVGVEDATLEADGAIVIGFSQGSPLNVLFNTVKGAVFSGGDGVNSGNWVCSWSNGSSGSSFNTSISVEGTRYLSIVMDSYSVRFYVEYEFGQTAVLQTSTTTNCPTSSDKMCFSAYVIHDASGGPETTLDLDFIALTQGRY